MLDFLNISNKDRQTGSYFRNTYRSDTIYTFYDYKEYNVVYSKKSFTIIDKKINNLLSNSLISQELYDNYYLELMKYFSSFNHLDSMCIEDIYDQLISIRKKYYDGIFLVDNDDILVDGFNQKEILDELLKVKRNILYIIEDELEKYALVNLLNNYDNPKYELKYLGNTLNINSIQYDKKIQSIIDEDDCILLCAGQGSYLALNNIKIDSFILGKADTYITKAFVNQRKGRHLLYVPKNFDIRNYVMLTSKSELTFSQLYYLWKDKGIEIYRDIDNLMNNYPNYFDNIYQNDNRHIDEIDLNKYHYQKIECLKGSEDCLVMHTIKVDKPFNIEVVENMKQLNLRELVHDYKGTYLVSNFLFFTTSKLMSTYNDQRKNRKDELIDESFNCHLDYKKDDGFESLSLYNKAIFAIDKSGEIKFFKLKKMSGYILINDKKYYFDENNFNTEEDLDLIIYTPYYSINDEDNENFIKEVGNNRNNIVMLQDKIVTIKKGNVLLPCVGYVLSFKEELDNDIKIEIHLNESNDIRLAYGGGMMLIDNGIDYTIDSLTNEGWLTPLSKLSQDTAIEKPSKHPRSAIGKLNDGSFILCVFDGRNNNSLGATYKQMCDLVRDVYPNVEYLMNIDGGASSFIGIIKDGVLKELSYPATSIGNVAGMARNVSTILTIKVD